MHGRLFPSWGSHNIDDILEATDTKEGHDKLVEEVLKRLEENDLFMKPEKYKQKVREVEFLGVVIGPRGVEMQKEKVEGVLNWPAPRCYENPKQEKVSHAFKHLMQNLKVYNRVGV